MFKSEMKKSTNNDHNPRREMKHEIFAKPIHCPKHKINEAYFNNISRFQNQKMAGKYNEESDDNGSHVVSPPPPYCGNPRKNLARFCGNKSNQPISNGEYISERTFGKNIYFYIYYIF